MSEQKEETQKTVVSFVVGLLIGGTLVWAFSGTQSTAPTSVVDDSTATTTETASTTEEDTTSKPTTTTNPDNGTATTPTPVATLPIGDGSVKVENQPAGSVVTLTSATFPIKEGWIGVRDYNDGNLGNILGVVRFSETQGIVPNQIVLQRATEAGKSYAITIFSENGDLEFSLANDVQIDKIFASFTAN